MPEQFINLYPVTDEERLSILATQLDRYRESHEYMETLYPSMIKAFKAYRSIADPMVDQEGKVIKGRSNLYIPYPHAIVENEMPRIAGRLPRVKAFPRKPGDKVKVDAIQDLIYYSLDRLGFIKLQTLWARQHAIYGWSPLFHYWRKEERIVLSRQQDPTGAWALIKEPQVVWDDFDARVLDVFDCYMQPGIEELEQSDWFIFREWVSDKDIKMRVEQGLFYPETLKYLEDNPRPSAIVRDGTGRRQRDDLIKTQSGLGNHFYGKHEILYVLEADKMYAVLNQDWLLRKGDNPNPLQELPIINFKLTPMVSEPIGISTLEALAGLPQKLNALSNTRMDQIALSSQGVMLADRYANTDFANLRMEAGNVILTDNMDSVKPLELKEPTISSEREVLTTKEELQFVSGVSDFIVGVQSSSRLSDTATGVSTIVREANAKFALKLAMFEAGSLRKFVLVDHAYNMVYMPYEKRIHILGPKGYQTRNVKLEEILCECDFVIEPGSSIPLDQLSRREYLLALSDRVLANPQIVDVPKFFRELFEAGDIRNADELLIVQDSVASDVDDIALAEAEDIALSQGQNIEVMGNDDIHIAVHMQYMKKNQSSDQEINALFMEHIKKHVLNKQLLTAQAAMTGGQSLFGGGENGRTDTEGNGGGNNQASGQPGLEAPINIPG